MGRPCTPWPQGWIPTPTPTPVPLVTKLPVSDVNRLFLPLPHQLQTTSWQTRRILDPKHFPPLPVVLQDFCFHLPPCPGRGSVLSLLKQVGLSLTPAPEATGKRDCCPSPRSSQFSAERDLRKGDGAPAAASPARLHCQRGPFCPSALSLLLSKSLLEAQGHELASGCRPPCSSEVTAVPLLLRRRWPLPRPLSIPTFCWFGLICYRLSSDFILGELDI